jgi:hypothetical protein
MKTRLFLVLSFFTLLLNSQTLTSNSTGFFEFTPTGPLSSKTIKVFYHIPNGSINQMPILFSFHGDARNADEYRDYWISMANQQKFMVFAPEFSEANFPGGDAYNLANIFDDGDNPSQSTFNATNEWTFSVIEPLFEQIKQAVSGSQQGYNAWGHSAGAQFLSRFVLYMPNSKLNVAVCSNAGWYTVPESTVNFPYGINNGQLAESTVISSFSKKLVVHLGLNDTDPNSAGLRHNTIVDNQQGMHRLERGRYFYTTSLSTAQTMNTTFNWEKREVANVGHNPQLMANDALNIFLNSSLSINYYSNSKNPKIYPNPTKDFLFVDTSISKTSKIEIYSIIGSLVFSKKLTTTNSTEKLDISKLPNGVYFLKINSSALKFIKN